MGPMGYGNNNDQRRGGCRGRLMGALLIAAIALFMYYSNTQVNPITGEKQRIAMTPSQEVQLGLQAAPEMAAKMGGEVPSSNPQAQEVQRVGNSLVRQTITVDVPWKFKFHLLADPKTINAFALPGGQIFITTGLMNQLTNEAQLAGVLGHEMGHVIERHSAQQMAKGQLGQMLILATQVGTSDSGQGAYGAAMIASVVNQMMQLRYSRGDELQADIWGLKIMQQAGYDPRAMLEVMAILKKASGSGNSPEMLLTHPYPENRIEQIKEYLQKHPPRGNLSEGREY